MYVTGRFKGEMSHILKSHIGNFYVTKTDGVTVKVIFFHHPGKQTRESNVLAIFSWLFLKVRNHLHKPVIDVIDEINSILQ